MFYYRSDGAMCAMLEISARIEASRETQSIDKDSDFQTQSKTLRVLRRNVMAKCPQRLNVMVECRCDAFTPSEPPECDAVGHTTLTTFPHNVLPAVPDSRPQQRQATTLLSCEFIGQATHKSGQFPLP